MKHSKTKRLVQVALSSRGHAVRTATVAQRSPRRGVMASVLGAVLVLSLCPAAHGVVVNYTHRTAYYTNTFTANNAGQYNSGTTNEVGLYAHTNIGQSVGWRTFRTADGLSGSPRELQVGDRFMITMFTYSPSGSVGCALLDAPSQVTTWNDRTNGARVILQAANNGDLYVTYTNGATTSWSGVKPESQAGGQTFLFDILSGNEVTVSLTNQTPKYDLYMMNSPSSAQKIDRFSIYLNFDSQGCCNNDAMWHPLTTVENRGFVEFGIDNGSRTIWGVISDGLAADSTSTVSSNNVLKKGTGAVAINATNTYTGYTEIQNGTLKVASDSNLGTAPTVWGSGHINIWNTGTLEFTASCDVNTNRGLEFGNTDGPTIYVDSGQSVSFTGVVEGAAQWSKDGAGTFFLGGNASTNTGKVTIKGGTLRIAATGSLGRISSTAATAEMVNVWSTGTFEFTNTFTLAPQVTIGIGNVSGSVFSVQDQSTITWGGVLAGNAAWSKQGPGTFIITASQTNAGPLVISNGAIRISHANGLGSTANGTTVASGGALELSGGITTAAEGLTLNGTGVGSGGALRNISGDNTNAGAITLGAAARINSDSGSLTLNSGTTMGGSGINLTVGGSANVSISSVIGTGSGTLTKDGSGTNTLSGNNTFTGTTTINGGVVVLGHANGLGTTAAGTTVSSGYTLDLNGQAVGAEALTLNGTGINALGALVNNSGTAASLSGTVALNAGSSIGGTGSETLTGVISGGNTLKKVGAGTLTLTAANTYTGATTNSAGSLIINGTNTSSAVVVLAGATNMGVGSIGGLTVIGQIAPGTNTIGVGKLDVTSLTLSNGSSYRCQIGDFSDTTSRDYINNSGAAPTVSNAVTVYVDSSALSNWNNAQNKSWNIIVGNVSSTNGLTLDETTYWNTGSFPKNGGAFSLSASGGSLVLTFTPTPVPDIAVLGTNAATIADGDVTPSTADGTDLGYANVSGVVVTNTFTVTNAGSALLSMGAVAIGGTHASDFSVQAQPRSFSNLLLNADFAQNGTPAALNTATINNWTTWGSSGYYNNDIDSQMSVKTWWDDSGIYQDWTCIAGARYDLSVYALQRSAEPLTNWHGYLKVEFYDASWVQLAAQELAYISSASQTDTWIQLSGSYTSPASSAHGRMVLGVNNWGAGAAGSAYFDNASVTSNGLAAGSQTTFRITFDPSAAGIRSATVYITNNVTGKTPYDFAIQGYGVDLIPPSGPRASVDGNEMVRLDWTNSRSAGVIVVHNRTNAPAALVWGTSYSVGDAVGSDGSRVVAKNLSGTWPEHIIPDGSTNFYTFYSYTDSVYSAGTTVSTSTLPYEAREIVDELCYTNAQVLTNRAGGHGWSAAWNAWPAFEINSNDTPSRPQFADMSGYPPRGGNRIHLPDPGGNVANEAFRSFPAVSTGTLYLAGRVSFQNTGTNRWCGFSAVSGTTHKVFFGESWAANGFLGLSDYGSGQIGTNVMKGWTNSLTNTYLVIAKYDFASRVFGAVSYPGWMSVTPDEPYMAVSDTIPANYMNSLDGIGIKAGSDNAACDIGECYWDEIRVAYSWNDLLRGTTPAFTNYAVGSGNSVYDGQITSGVFTVSATAADTNGIGAATFDFDIWNPSGIQILTNEHVDSQSWANGGKNSTGTDTNHAGYYPGDLGTYTTRWSVATSNGYWLYDRTTLSNGTTMSFSVVDDDTEVPQVGTGTATNILQNPSFELGNDASTISNWNRSAGNTEFREGQDSSGYKTVTAIPSGTNILKEFGTGAELVQSNITAVAGAFYHAYAQFYHNSTNDSICQQCGADSLGELFKIIWYNSSQVPVYTNYSTEYNASYASNVWSFINLYIQSPTNAATASFHILTSGGTNNAGSLYADDFHLTREARVMSVWIGNTNMSALYDGGTNAIHTLTDGDVVQVSTSNRLKLVFGAYDTNSGLARGTTGSSSQMNVDVGSWLTDNVTNYVASNSSPITATTSADATSVWAFDNVDLSAVMNLTNLITVSLKDADNDRANDQATLTNQQYGYIAVVDDDSTAPTFASNAYTRPMAVVIGTNQAGSDLTTNAVFNVTDGSLLTINTNNMTIDPSLETNSSTYWGQFGPPGNATYAPFFPDGPGSQHGWFRSDTAGANGGFYQSITGSPGQTYIFTARVRNEINTIESNVFIRFEWYQADNATRAGVDGGVLNIASNLTTSYQTFTTVGTAPTNTVFVRPVINFSSDVATSGCGSCGVFFDNLIVQTADLRLVINAYDTGSGLSRGTTDATTQMNVDVDALIVDNVSNYNASLSSVTSTGVLTTSTWQWVTAFNSTEIQTLFTNGGSSGASGSNRVQVSLKDADFDRAGDQLTVTNMLFGYMKVIDDDTTPPQFGTNLHGASMDFQIGPSGSVTSYYQSGSGTAGICRVTDADLVQVSAANPMRFVFNIFDGESGVRRANGGSNATNLNYDVGTLPNATNLFTTYSNVLSSANTISMDSTSVFYHTAAFSYGGSFVDGSGSTETGEIIALITAVTNRITLSANNLDEDRGSVDVETFTDWEAGRLVVVDDDTAFPTARLDFVGASYSPGATNSQAVTDGDLINHSLDFAMVWYDASGLLVTNEGNSAPNLGSLNGNVCPNYDFVTPSGVTQANDVFFSPTSMFPRVNGSLAVTTIAWNATQIVYTNNELGTWQVAASAQDYDRDRAMVTDSVNGNIVSVDRAVATNQQVSFAVVDDDTGYPSYATNSAGFALSVLVGGTQSIGGVGTYTNAIFDLTDGQAASAGGINMVRDGGFENGFSEYVIFTSGVYVVSADRAKEYGTNGFVLICTTNGFNGFYQDVNGASVGTQYIATIRAKKEVNFSASTVEFKLEFFDGSFAMQSATTNYIQSQLSTNWQTFTITNTAPATTVYARPVFSYSGGAPVGGAPTNKDLLVDDLMLKTNNFNALYLVFHAFDTNSGIAFGLTDPNTQMNISVGSQIISNVVNYSAADGSPTSTGPTSSNVWKFGAINQGQIQAMIDAGSNRVSANITDADNDRANDSLAVSNQLFGYLRFTDDDNADPAVGTAPLVVMSAGQPVSAWTNAGTTNAVLNVSDGQFASASATNPLMFSFNVSDASGIRRNLQGAGTNMNVTIVMVTTNNTTNYESTVSSADTTLASATSVWQWVTAFSATEVSNLFGSGAVGLTNRVTATVPDADNDREGDSRSLNNQQFGYIWMYDDDTDAPIRVNFLGMNLLSNSSFEVAGWWSGIANGWDATNYPNDKHGAIYGNYFRSDYRAHGGAYSASIPGQWGGNTFNYGGWYQDVTNSYGNGVAWRASVWARSDQGWTGYCALAIEFYAADSSTRMGAATNSFANPTGAWTYVSVLATAPAGTVWSRIVMSGDNMANVGSIYYDDAVLQVATNATLPMDLMLGNTSYYRDGAGTNGNYQISDADLASVSQTNLLKFIYRVYDPSSGVARTAIIGQSSLNYDIGSIPSESNINWTYTSTLSSADSTLVNATSVFAHTSNFTLGGYQTSSNVTETGEVYQMLAAVSNQITVSLPNQDIDRGEVDREWVYDNRFGFLVVYDDDSVGPFVTLKYLGTNYSFGTLQTNTVIYDSDMRGALDFAYEMVDPSGIFLTNSTASSTNSNGNLGNVNPNWELRSPAGTEYSSDWILPATSLFASAGNGSEFATAVWYNVNTITYDANTVGVWTLQASAQDMDNDRGSVTMSNGQVVALDRGIRANSPMTFNVIDDDSNYPSAYDLTINTKTLTNLFTDEEMSTGFLVRVRFGDDVSGIYTATANGAFSPPVFSLINASNNLVQTNKTFTNTVVSPIQLVNGGFETAGTNSGIADGWNEICYDAPAFWWRSNGVGRAGAYALAGAYSGPTNLYGEIPFQWVDVSNMAVGETVVFGGWLKISNSIPGNGRTLVKYEWWDTKTTNACPAGNFQGASIGTLYTTTGNGWINAEVTGTKPTTNSYWLKAIIEVTFVDAVVTNLQMAWDDMYIGTPVDMEASRAGVTVPYSNFALGTYSFEWTGQDSDNDRTNDTLGYVLATNMTYGGNQFTVIDDDSNNPVAVDLWANGYEADWTNAYVSDQQIHVGLWPMSFRFQDYSGIATDFTQGWLPNYSFVNSGGVTVNANQAFNSLVEDGTRTNIIATRSMGGVAYSDVTLGDYQIQWSAADRDNDRADDWMARTNSGYFRNDIGSTTNLVHTYDDDTNGPSIVTNVQVDIVVWTNVDAFNVTFNAATDDFSGIYEYRYDTNTAPSTLVTDGVPITGVATSQLAIPVSNLDFEIGQNGNVVPDFPGVSNSWQDFSADNATGQWTSAQHHSGTNAMRHIIAAGWNGGGAHTPRYTLVSQLVDIGNSNGYPVRASLSGWFKGDMSASANGSTGTAFLKMEFFNASTTQIQTVDDEYGTDHNGSPLFAVNAAAWTNVMITATNGSASTKFIRFICGTGQHGTELGYDTYWDDLVITVKVIGAVGNAYSFTVTNAMEGIRTNSLFGVDDDDDRPNDRSKGLNTNFITMLDQTAPPQATGLSATGGLDEATEIRLDWTAVADAGNRTSSDNAVLSPWRTYYIFYEECTNCNVATTSTYSRCFTNNGFANLGTNLTTTAILSNLNFDSTYRFVVAGQDRAGNMGTLSSTVTLSTLNFIVTQGIAAASTRVDISWLASSNNNTYDMLCVDGTGYSDSYSNLWTNLAGTVTNSFMSDTGSASRVSPQDLGGGTMRFYRVSRQGQWATNASPRRGSKEIYLARSYWLVPGENWISLPMLPDTNRPAVWQIFGTNRLPAGSTIGVATKMSWYGHTAGSSTNAAGVATNVIWLSSSGRWLYSMPTQLTGQVADNWKVPTNEAFNVEIPTGSATQKFVVVGRLPTNESSTVIYGANGQTNYSTVCYAMPYQVTISQLQLKECGFSGGLSVARSDEIRILSNTNGMGSMQAPKARIWLNGSTTNFTYSLPLSGNANNHVIQPGEAIVIVRKRGPSMTWTNKLYYAPPGKNINP